MNKTILLTIIIGLTSCNNSSKETSALKEQIISLQSQNEVLIAEKNKLEDKINDSSTDNDRDIQQIGRWFDNRQGSDKHIITIFKNIITSKYFIKDTFGDGSTGTEEARQLNYNGLKRYEAINNAHNEYYVVEKNGDLSAWSQNGKFAEFPNF